VDFLGENDGKKWRKKKRGLSQRFITRTKQEKKKKGEGACVCVLKRGVEPRTFRELNNISSF
jgi:hypothetical protein